MSALPIKNVPGRLFESEEKNVPKILQRVKKLRQKTKGLYLTPRILQAAKNDGRP